MVSQEVIAASNRRLPSKLVGVFVGATSGIGEYTLKSFAKHCSYPTAYFVGRSQPAADRILGELKTINSNGTYTFIQSDISLVKNVDAVCAQVLENESFINVLIMSQATFLFGMDTAEGVHFPASLLFHSRTRFTLNLLPLLQAAPTLRRVVSIFTGTKEGPIVNEDLQVRKMSGSPLKLRGQAASCVTLAMEEVAKRAPDVSFIHDYPGPVRGNMARDGGWFNLTLRVMAGMLGPIFNIPDEVSGDRHVFLATSARYPANKTGADGVEVEKGTGIAKGTDGKIGSGVYVVNQVCESGDEKVVNMLEQLRAEGKNKFVWDFVEGELKRITGKVSI
jgi:hypothetical protein